MWSELNEHIKNINNLAGFFWDRCDLDPWGMLDLIESKKFILEWILDSSLEPSLKKILKKVDRMEKEYYKELPRMTKTLKKTLREEVLTMEDAEESLEEFIQEMRIKNFANPETHIKIHLQRIEQRLLGKNEDKYYQILSK